MTLFEASSRLGGKIQTRRFSAATATYEAGVAEPHLTNGLIGLRNVLKNVLGYGAQYAIEGGMERLPRRLAAQLTATDVRLNSPVVRVSRHHGGRYSLEVRHDRRRVRTEDFEAVVVALPYNLLRNVEWAGERLRRAMTRHIAYYDRPGHYLRISILFDEPFWRRAITGSWMMMDAFGGCCVYDECAGSDTSGHGVLGWLLAGSDALALCNADDRTLVDRAVDSLPDALRAEAGRHVVEGRVHRWAGALSGTPGGFPLRDHCAAHQPEPVEHEHLTMVGDYLFDSTLNGVLRSAEIATDLVLRDTYSSASRRSRRALSQSRRTVRSVISSASAISASVMPAK